MSRYEFDFLFSCMMSLKQSREFHENDFAIQMLEFRVLNVHSGTESFRGRLPLTPGSYLTWFGFSEEGQLGSFDSKVHLISGILPVKYLSLRINLIQTE